LFLCLTKNHIMRTYESVEVQFHIFLTSTLDGGEWPASCPGCLTPRERAPSIHWIGGWVRTRADLDAVMKRKIPASAGKQSLVVQLIA